MLRRIRAFALSVVLLLLPALASAQDYYYSVYLDNDGNAATGCTVTGANGATFAGVETQLTAEVAGNPPRVQAVRMAQCVGTSFAPSTQVGGNYAVGLNNGLQNGDVIELALRRVLAQNAGLARLGFGARSASGSLDHLYTTNGTAGGPPITFGLPARLIPLLGPGSMTLLALLLAGLAVWTLKRHPATAQVLLLVSGLSVVMAAYAAVFAADGAVNDWSTVGPVARDPIDDSVPPLTATDIIAGFAAEENGTLFFRIDVVDAENQPPVASNDSYNMLEDQVLALPAPGVLFNDSDPDADPLTVQLGTTTTRGTLALAANGGFTYTPNANLNGTDSFTYRAFDGQVSSSLATATIDVTPVNDAPSFTAGPNQTVLEDAGPQTVANWATALNDGDPEVTQTLSFGVPGTSNPALFSSAPLVSPTGTLTYTPAANAIGSATITLRITDDGGTEFGGVNQSAIQTFTITVTAVNDAPSFTAGPNQTVLEDAGPQTVTGWASAIDDGDPDLNQALNFTATVTGTTGNLAFTAPPAVNASTGTLTYTASPNTAGVATVQLRLADDGSNTAPNVNISPIQTFTISVTGVNDAPVFSAGPNQTVNEDAGLQSVANWATGIDDGDGDAVQALNFNLVGNTNPGLFSSAPDVSSTGTLTFETLANASGMATLTLRLDDSGGTANGGVNQSATRTFTITVNAVNDAPSFVAGPNQESQEDAGAQVVTAWATGISAGPADEAGQTLAFTIAANSNPGLFSSGPAISPAGVLSYTAAPNANGLATLSATLADSGPGTPPDANTSAAQTFTIRVLSVNDAPVNTVPGPQVTGAGTPLVFSTANGNAISVDDLDLAGSELLVGVRLQLSQSNAGTLTLGSTAGLSNLAGNGAEVIDFRASISNANAALEGLRFQPAAGFGDIVALQVSTNDEGNIGAPGALIDQDNILISVDEAPLVSATPNGGTVASNVALAVNFSEPVNVAAGMTLSCGGGPDLLTGGTTGSNIGTLSPTYAGTLPAGSCTLALPAASVTDVDTIDPPDNPASDFSVTFTVDAAPAVTTTNPTTGATTASNVALAINFSEPVNATAGSVTLTCGGANLITGGDSGSAVSVLNPTYAGTLPSGACVLTVLAANISDSDNADPPNALAANTVVNFNVDAAPVFVSANPAAGSTVGSSAIVSFTYDEAVNGAAGAITLDCGSAVPGTLGGNGSTTLTFTPSSPLPAGASCTATAVAAQISDADALDPPQNPAADVVRTFSVDAAPAITTTTPLQGATNAGIADNLVLNFSEPVSFADASFTLNCGAAVPFTSSGSGTATATIDPTANLPINTACTLVVLAAGINDADANDPPDNLATNFTLNFTTVNDSAPTVTTSVPANGSTVASNTPIAINFSENVNASAGSVTLTCGGANLITGGASGSNITALAPTYAGNLPEGASCTLTVLAANVSDADAIDPPDQMVANFVSSFTVDAAPAFVSAVPAAAAVVASDSQVSYTFSEPVTASAGAITLDCGGAVPGALSGSGTATLVFDPTGPLPAGASCTATAVAAQIADSDVADPPNLLPANVVRSFSVDAAPAITGGTPANGAANVSTSPMVTFTFSEPVTASAGAITLNCAGNVAGTLAGSGTSTLSFTPGAPIAQGASCTATAVAALISDADAIDPPNNPAADVARSFTTDSAPVVGSTLPTQGSISTGIADNLVVNFSEPVSFGDASFTLNCGAAVPFSSSGSGTATATIDPGANLPVNTACTLVVLAAGISDADAGDPPDNLATNFTLNFTTVNDSAPAVASTTPANGSTVAANPLLGINFSEAVNATAGAVTLTCGGANLITGGSSGSNVTTLAPTYAGPLPAGATCTLTVLAANVTDADGIDPPDQMAANFVATFSVDAAPAVSGTTPADGASGIAIAAGSITVNFSENVDVAAGGITLGCPGSIELSGLPASNTNSVTLNHPGLPGGATCTLTVLAASVSDADALDPPQQLVANFTSSFTTVDAAPSVVSTDPGDGNAEQTPSDPITITFSEPVNFSTLANAANSSFDLECPASTPANFSVLTASPATVVVLDPADAAVAGRTCTLTVRAAGITDVDAADPPDSMAADFSASFNYQTVPVDDAYMVTPHLTLAVDTGVQGGRVTANDLPSSATVDAFGFGGNCFSTAPGDTLDAGAANGRLTLNANGSFSYEPPPGVVNSTRTFCYGLADGNTADIVFTIGTTELVWFVAGGAAPGGSGTQGRPFQTLAAAAAVDTANDTIHLAANASPYTCGITLQAGEQMIGAGASGTLAALTGITPVQGSAFPALGGVAPQLSVGSGACLTLATGNTLRGFEIADSGTDLLGNAFGTLTVAEVSLHSAGKALDLSNGTLAATFGRLQSNSSTTEGVDLDNVSGALSVGATGTAISGSGAAAPGIRVSSSAASLDFGVTTVAKGNAGAGVDLASNTGPITFASLAITTSSGGGLMGGDNSGLITVSTASAGGIQATGGPALSLSNTVPTAVNLQLGPLSSTSSPTSAVSLVRVNGTVNASGGLLQGSAITTVFSIIGGNANVSYGGGIDADLATLVSVNGATGGSKLFSGAITDGGDGDGSGIRLTNNSGATITFSGGLTLSTGANPAFVATGGGTVNVTGAANTLATTTGTALNVTDTTIGASDLSFRSISAGTAGSGPASGIVLTNTGTQGSLMVTGNGGAGSGGTIQRTTSHGIALTNTLEPSFQRMVIDQTGGDGVSGTEVNGFTFANGTISNSGTDGVANRANIGFDDTTAGTERNLYGVVSIIDNTLTNSRFHGIRIFNYSGTLSDLEISGNTLTSSTSAATSQGSGIVLAAFGSASTVANVSNAEIANNVISNFPGGAGLMVQGGNANAGGPAGIFGTAGNAGSIIDITGNRIAGQNAANRMAGEAIVASVNGRGQGNFNISGNGTVANPISHVSGIAISHSAFGEANVTSTIANNVIVANNLFAAQGIGFGLGNTFGVSDAPQMTTTISGNTISATDGNGILGVARNTNGTLRARVLNNTVAAPLTGVRPGIRIDSGIGAGGNDTVCLNIAGNTSAGSGGSQGIGLRKQGTLPGTFAFGINGMAATATPGVENFVNGLNPAGNGTLLISATSGFSNCNLP